MRAAAVNCIPAIGAGLVAVPRRFVTLLAAAFLGFVFADGIGDPVAMLAPMDATLADRAALRRELGLDQPILIRFAQYLSGIATGDFGVSLRSSRPVLEILREALPVTFDMALLAIAFSLLASVPTAVAIARYPASLLSRWLSGGTVVAVAMPIFVTCYGLTALFCDALGWLPAYGRGATVDILGWRTGLLTPSGLAALVLPSLAVGLQLSGLFAALLSERLSDILQSGYIRAALSRGLPPASIYYRHALSNAWPGLVGVASVHLGNVMVFAIVTETMFQRPGLGFVFFRAVSDADGPVVAACIIVAALIHTISRLAGEFVLRIAQPDARWREEAACRTTAP